MDDEQVVLSVTFGSFQLNLQELATYVTTMTPHLGNRRGTIDLFVKGLIVMAVAHYEEFLQGLLSAAVAPRTEEVRQHFLTSGSPNEKRLAVDATRKTLAALVHARVSFESAGARIEKTFQALFGCSAWPDDTTRNQIVEFAVMRNLIVHARAAEVGLGDNQPQATRLQARHVFEVTNYGDATIYRLDPVRALRLCTTDALQRLDAQFHYLKQHLLPAQMP